MLKQAETEASRFFERHPSLLNEKIAYLGDVGLVFHGQNDVETDHVGSPEAIVRIDVTDNVRNDRIRRFSQKSTRDKLSKIHGFILIPDRSKMSD